jgi:hypothetical protein
MQSSSRWLVLPLVLLLGAAACNGADSDDDDNDAEQTTGGSAGSSSDGPNNNGGDGSDGEGGSGSKGNPDGPDNPDNPDEPDEPGEPGVTSKIFFLPTTEPDNTAAPTLEVDADGGLHALYPAYAGGGAYYAYCPENCTGPKDVKVVPFSTEGTVANAMLALTKDGKPRILLSAYRKVYYGECDSNCGKESSWSVSEILDHGSDNEISGEAFALDSHGNPRFLMHVYRALWGIGQDDPFTWYATCDGDCTDGGNWTYSEIATEIWEGTTLRFDADDRAHIATVINFAEGENAGKKLSAYLLCEGDCTSADDWNGIGFVEPYESMYSVVDMKPTVSLALTKNGAPRLVVLGTDGEGAKNLLYFECDEDCIEDNWTGSLLSNHEEIEQGLDLALDSKDRPRIVYTLDFNIGLLYCDDKVCGGPDSTWGLTKVELGSEMDPDEIFLWDNCNVAAWFLHGPSVAITPSGEPRVGYQARDISGGWSNPDPTKPDCVAGTDMTWSRLAVMPSHR